MSSPKHISRRRVLQRGAMLAGTALAAPAILAASPARADESLVFVGYGGSTQAGYEKYHVDPFVADTGIKVTRGSGPDLAKLKAMVQTGKVEWDVVLLVSAQGVEAERQGLLEEIDYSIVKKVEMVFPARRCCFPFTTFWSVIAYDPRRLASEKVPTDWPGFWDVAKFPGRRAIRDRVEENLEIALMADGVAPKDLYPLDVDRAFKSLDRIKPHITKFVLQTPQTVSLVQTGEIDLSYTYAGRVVAMQDDGVSMEYKTGQPLLMPNYVGVVKGTKHREAAMRLLDYFMRPDRQVAFNNAMPGSGIVARAGIAQLTGKTAALEPDYDSPETTKLNVDWWADNYPALSKRWKEWLLA
jgi:putative spermidine/putrescine transport system substrate-binding protein